MNSDWLGSTGDRLSSSWGAISSGASGLGHPQRIAQIRLGLCALAVIWMAWALSQLVWQLLPGSENTPAVTNIINPLSADAQGSGRSAVNIEELAAWDLFGAPLSETVVAEPEPVQTEVPAGIEDGARETRLNLNLRGLVASSVPEEARAIIEYQNKQDQYAVGDKLPVSGNVKLAKVLADRIVLDNGGKYELLMLFDDDGSSVAALQRPEPEPRATGPNTRTLDKRGAKDVTQMAESYRQKLYKDPTSLAQAVRISAQRVDGELQGYRVSPGRDKEQFGRLGFEPNDLVTGVNGIELTDPGKAMELYKVMRSAKEATFDVTRGGEEMTLVVGLETEGDSE